MLKHGHFLLQSTMEQPCRKLSGVEREAMDGCASPRGQRGSTNLNVITGVTTEGAVEKGRNSYLCPA